MNRSFGGSARNDRRHLRLQEHRRLREGPRSEVDPTADRRRDGVCREAGWTVDPRYIFVDENTSGAEWTRRPGFNALLATLDPSPPFGVVIASELSRIGHNTVRTPAAVMRIEEAARARLGSPSQAPSLRRAERRTRCADGDEALPAADRTRPARGREGRAHAL